MEDNILPVVLTLSGGLGNQLFQLNSGLYIENFYSREVIFNISNLVKPLKNSVGNYTRNLEILDLILQNELITSKYPMRLDSPVRLAKRLLSPEVVLKEIDPLDLAFSRFSNNTISVYGYFQNYSLVEAMWPHMKAVLQKSPTFKRFASPKKIDRIAIHVRFGDYSDDPKTKATHGLTDIEYFNAAIDEMQSKSRHKLEILIISDDIQKARGAFGEIWSESEINFESNSSPIADLMAISQSSHVVMSNSTFSWWGAWFAFKSHSADVIFPRPWFADTKDTDLPIYVPYWTSKSRTYKT